jgi:lysophospholipase L1-like esterase
MSKTLVFMGDSITDCGRTASNDQGPNSGFGPGYPNLIGSKLLGEHPEDGWTIYNRGIGGHRIVDLYARWKIDALNLKPDYISILIGVNDVWHEKVRQNGVDTPRFEQFYKMLLDWSLQALPKVKFILMEPFVLEFGAVTGKDWVEDVAEKAKVVRKMARKYGTAFVPLQELFNQATKRAPMEYWLRDGVHPLPPGHQLIANAWAKAAAKVGIKI